MRTHAHTVIALDLGGSKISAARVRLQDMTIENRIEATTPADKGFHAVLKIMTGMVNELKTKDTHEVGIGVPGFVESGSTVIRDLPNIPGAADVDLSKAIADATGLAVTLGNDARNFTLAEALHGAGKGFDPVIGVTIGTGVGGGLFIDGKLMRGAHGFAGEIGHLLLTPGSSPAKGGGPKGEAEQYFSGTAISQRCPEAAATPADVFTTDKYTALRDTLITEMAWFFSSLAGMLDPGIIVIGGGVGRTLGPHLPAIIKETKLWLPKAAPAPRLAIATLQDPGILGAALLTTLK